MEFETFDNKDKILRDDLAARLAKGDSVSVAAPCFSVYGFEALKRELKGCSEFRFLYTEPTFLKAAEKKELREFYVPRQNRERGVAGTELEIRLRNDLSQRAIAGECAKWARNKVCFRSLGRGLGGIQTSLTVRSKDETYSYYPLGGFTAPALGTVSDASSLYPVMRQGSPVSDTFLSSFEAVWKSDEHSEDVTDQVISSLASLYRENPPELVYYSALNDIFSEFLQDLNEDALPKEVSGFRDSKVWNLLYDFQRDAVTAIINKLERFNGCILADSVGLGKTFTALAVVKYYETRNCRVLVLCPKKLSENWLTYRANQRNNPLADDLLRYDVLYHTDLSRTRGTSGNGLDLAALNWENYDLIVIDESHNFRNGADSAKGDEGENRYQRLMNKVIRRGVPTKVLMLSATPVNNRFRDLQNQLELAYAREGDWQGQMGLSHDVRTTFRNAQAVYTSWSELPVGQRTTQALMDRLDPDFFTLLDQVTVARSRRQIQRYYDVSAMGPFPRRLDPISLRPGLSDSPEVGSFSQIAELLGQLKLASYMPSAYIQPSKVERYKEVGISAAGRERGVRRLMAINLLKRLESSVNSFRLTLGKVMGSVQDRINLVDEYERDPNKIGIREFSGTSFDPADFDLDPDDEDGSEGLRVRGSKVRLEDMDWLRWRRDMRADLQVLGDIARLVRAADPAHDSKLTALRELILQKVDDPINQGNRKVLVFTAFADTAEYLYQNIAGPALERRGLRTAIVTGSKPGRSNVPGVPASTNELLACFSPVSKGRDAFEGLRGKDIDILIATDCISEGQNLQDCDYVVNYDIHWNPVRIVQRFGRVDRIGSKNERIQLVNFWPDVELDEYIRLKGRVEDRMHLTVMTSTGDDDYINPEEQGDLDYRRNQLEQMLHEVTDMEDVSGGVSITDLGLDEFRSDLLSWRKDHPDVGLPPHGVHAVVEGDEPGIVFVLRNLKEGAAESKGNRLHPFYLVYVGEDGRVLQDQNQARDILSRIRVLCRGKSEPDTRLCDWFNELTDDGHRMDWPSRLLQAAAGSAADGDQASLADSFFSDGVSDLGKPAADGLDDFELLDFLVVH